jgi:FAD/FMN-containing dehydrogenase
MVGHVGDGNFHTTIMVDLEDAKEVEAASQVVSRLAKRAIALGGTCTGEHGIGQGKMAYLEEELGKPAVDMMRVIKQSIDPDNIFNPGKIFAV